MFLYLRVFLERLSSNRAPTSCSRASRLILEGLIDEIIINEIIKNEITISEIIITERSGVIRKSPL